LFAQTQVNARKDSLDEAITKQNKNELALKEALIAAEAASVAPKRCERGWFESVWPAAWFGGGDTTVDTTEADQLLLSRKVAVAVADLEDNRYQLQRIQEGIDLASDELIKAKTAHSEASKLVPTLAKSVTIDFLMDFDSDSDSPTSNGEETVLTQDVSKKEK
jgi:hypothetical protein